MSMRKDTMLRRLIKISSFLKTLPPDKFNYAYTVTKWDKEHNCGAVCCAVDWMPMILPEDFKWDDKLQASVVKSTGKYAGIGEIQPFLGLNWDLMNSIFLGFCYTINDDSCMAFVKASPSYAGFIVEESSDSIKISSYSTDSGATIMSKVLPLQLAEYVDLIIVLIVKNFIDWRP